MTAEQQIIEAIIEDGTLLNEGGIVILPNGTTIKQLG
jgi:hypothetical protein